MAWGQTGTIEFGTNKVKINAAVVYAQDNLGNTWDLGTTGTTSFTANADYYQIGSSSKPASKITFKTTLPNDVTITSFSAKFGGFNGTAGTITLSVDDETVGTGSLNGTDDVTVTSSSEATGKEIKVTVTDIAKGVKCYYVSYTYTSSTPSVAVPTFLPASGAVAAGTEVTLTQGDASLIMYTLDGTDPSFENSIGYEYENPIVITTPTTIKAIAVDNDGNVSPVASASYTIEVTAPSFTPNGGEVDEGSTVTITAGEGSSIYYTVDGTDPTNASTPYTSPISINNALTLKAIAYDAYGNASNVTTRNFTVKIADGIEITPNNSFFGKSGTISGSSEDEVTGTSADGIKLTYTRNNGSLYLYNTSMRFYKSNTLKIDAPTGKSIVKVVFTQSNGQTDDMASNPAGYTNSTKTWEGESTSVTFSRPDDAESYLQFTKITVVLSDNGIETVATPQFSVAGGEYDEAQTVEINCTTEGAAIHFTIDGSNPTAESTTYTSAITISETTTLKAIAVKEGMNNSQIAEATYTITTGGETPVTSDWVKAELADLTSDDIFVIVGNNGVDYALANDNGTSSAPKALKVTVDGNYLTGEVADNIKWNISGNATDGYTFYPNGSTTTWLYCTNDNNGVRVGDNNNKTFKVAEGYLQHVGTSRYVGVYNSSDWRCYTSINNNIKNQTFAFYKYTGAPAPSITADDWNITYDITEGEISYTVNNPVDGGVLTAATEADWLTMGEVGAAAVAFTATQNETALTRTAEVVLSYTYGEGLTVSKTVTITQTGNPDASGTENNPYTVAEALEVINALADNGKTSEVYTTGTITRIQEVSVYDETTNDGYGNATYFISDGTNELEVFRGFYLDKTKFTAEDQIQVGDVVVVYGQLQKYVKNETVTPEITSGNYIVSLDRPEPITFDEKANNASDFAAVYNDNVGENKNVQMLREFGYDYWNTLVVPFDLTRAQLEEAFGEGVQVAKYTGFKTPANIKFEKTTGDVTRADLLLVKPTATVTNPIFKGVTLEAGKAYTYPEISSSWADGTLFKITGRFAKQVLTDDDYFGKVYFLNKQGQFTHPRAEGNVIRGFRWFIFLKTPESTGAKVTLDLDGEATSIEAIDNGEQAGGKQDIFNLAGQRVQKAQKGIYIVNGKKVVVK